VPLLQATPTPPRQPQPLRLPHNAPGFRYRRRRRDLRSLPPQLTPPIFRHVCAHGYAALRRLRHAVYGNTPRHAICFDVSRFGAMPRFIIAPFTARIDIMFSRPAPCHQIETAARLLPPTPIAFITPLPRDSRRAACSRFTRGRAERRRDFDAWRRRCLLICWQYRAGRRTRLLTQPSIYLRVFRFTRRAAR